MICARLLDYEQGKDYLEISIFSVYDGVEGVDRSMLGFHISRCSVIMMFFFMDFEIWSRV